ncbi:DUF4304 domain-containing protein [Shewanella baltica]|uniref:DUF4304 domain-containing protein n=1 Tax=Shewanella baltica TaxID=62322 RepID=UPI003D00BE1F
MDRKQVETELKRLVVPTLREMGFKGSFPNFYRCAGEFVSLLNFQFYSSGGSLCINISFADPARENVNFRKETEPKKLTISQTTERARLGATSQKGDYWFSFGKTSYGELRGSPAQVEEMAEKINNLLKVQAEPWWVSKCTS